MLFQIYCNIHQHQAKQLTLHPVEAYSEPFQTSKQGDYFYEKLHFRCLKKF